MNNPRNLFEMLHGTPDPTYRPEPVRTLVCHPANQYKALKEQYPNHQFVEFTRDYVGSPSGNEYDAYSYVDALVEVKNCRDQDGTFHHRVYAFVRPH